LKHAILLTLRWNCLEIERETKNGGVVIYVAPRKLEALDYFSFN